MIIWLLALLLFGCLGFAGWAFGAVRAAFTFVGLFISLFVAKMFGHSLEPVLGHLGAKNPMVAWVLAPFVVFVVALMVCKIFGYVANQKVEHYYKYKAGDLRTGLWKRLNPRLGLCMGLANAAVYMVLISMVIYPFSYATAQLASGDDVNWSVKLLNSAGGGLQSSGMNRVAGAIDPMPDDYYQAVDLAGVLYHNPLYEARLTRYPPFLGMGQRSEFQALSGKDFTELVQTEPPVSQIWNDSRVQQIVGNPDLLKEIWALVKPNFKDLALFLKTDVSQKYDEKILGQWTFNMNGALTELRIAKPNMTSREMLLSRGTMSLMFAKTTLVATMDNNTLYLKNYGKVTYVPVAANPGMGQQPMVAPAPVAGGRGGRGGRGGAPVNAGPRVGAAPPPNMIPKVDLQDLKGDWKSEGLTDYRLSFPEQRYQAAVDGDKLTITGGQYPMVFERDY